MASLGPGTTAEAATVGVDLSSRTAVVTGAASGLGAETARVLALRGAHVIMACRNLARADETRRRILMQSRGLVSEQQLELRRLDLSSFASVRTFARELRATKRPLHLLINHADVFFPMRRETVDGFEAHLGINYLGHFLLTSLLLETLEASAPARVIAVSSEAMRMTSLDVSFADLLWQKRPYKPLRAYADSKLMNLMFVRELSRRLVGTEIVAHAVHPGVVARQLMSRPSLQILALTPWLWRHLKTTAQGAATTLVAATHPAYGQQSGLYLADCRIRHAHRLSRDPGACRRLWEISAQLVAERGHELEHSLLRSPRARA